jgi:hypothetical protein
MLLATAAYGIAIGFRHRSRRLPCSVMADGRVDDAAAVGDRQRGARGPSRARVVLRVCRGRRAV